MPGANIAVIYLDLNVVLKMTKVRCRYLVYIFKLCNILTTEKKGHQGIIVNLSLAYDSKELILQR